MSRALADVADAAGNVDGYCAAQQRMGPRVRDDAGMARRLLDAGRPADALAALTAAEPNPAKNAAELADLRITVLDALGRTEDAQALRWSEFERGLRAEPLRAYLKQLSDVADVDKEEETLDLVATHPDVQGALAFLTAWPDLRRAGALVRVRFDGIDGNGWWTLTPAAERLENKEPLAASLLYRRMIDFTLSEYPVLAVLVSATAPLRPLFLAVRVNNVGRRLPSHLLRCRRHRRLANCSEADPESVDRP